MPKPYYEPINGELVEITPVLRETWPKVYILGIFKPKHKVYLFDDKFVPVPIGLGEALGQSYSVPNLAFLENQSGETKIIFDLLGDYRFDARAQMDEWLNAKAKGIAAPKLEEKKLPEIGGQDPHAAWTKYRDRFFELKRQACGPWSKDNPAWV